MAFTRRTNGELNQILLLLLAQGVLACSDGAVFKEKLERTGSVQRANDSGIEGITEPSSEESTSSDAVSAVITPSTELIMTPALPDTSSAQPPTVSTASSPCYAQVYSSGNAWALWGDFKAGQALVVGDKVVRYVDIGAQDDTIPNSAMISLSQGGADDVAIGFSASGFNFTAAFQYTIETTNQHRIFGGVRIDSNVSVNAPLGFGRIDLLLGEPNVSIASLNGWPAPTSGGLQPIPNSLKKLTVTNSIVPNAGGVLFTLGNYFSTKATCTSASDRKSVV